MRRCAPWSSTPPAARCVSPPTSTTPSPARARRSSPSTRAASAAPTCTSSTASSTVRRRPLIPGHQIVGTVLATGDGASVEPGSRVGIPWLGWTCGECRYCRSGRENLCVRGRFTGLDIDGGYATRAVADTRYCFAAARGLRRPRGRAAPLRGADRPPRPADVRRRRAPRPLRLRRLGAHRLPGRDPPGPARVRVHPRRRHRLAGVRALARLRVGGRRDGPRRRRSSTPRSSSPPSARSCRPRCGRSRPPGSSCAPGST